MNVKRLPAFIIALLMLFPGAAGAETAKKDPFSQTKFLPGISFILDFSYNRRGIDQDIFQALEIPGFPAAGSHGGEDGHAHGASASKDGFNLNYGELVLFASVDPYFDLFSSFHLTESEFEIEEAYVTTRRLPYGFKAKLGKFLSGFGRLNSQHAHLWDFREVPLVYQVFFGAEGLSDIGIQLNWIAPLDVYLSLGAETLQGRNAASFGIEEFHVIDADSEEELHIEAPPLPNLWIFFAKTSLDWGDFVCLAGASYALGNARVNMLEEEHEPFAFEGKAKILGLDFTLKYIIDSYRHLSFQAEYISRFMKGSRYEPEDRGDEHEHEETPEVGSLPYDASQAGLYAQIVYRFHKQWRLGARWDRLNKNNTTPRLDRFGVMMDYSPTEFSRIRLQYNINRYTFFEEERKNYNELIVQFNLAIGAHGAHSF